MAKPLVIGIGNLHAGDDAAGRLVAQALARAPGFDVIESHGAAGDLVTAFEGRDRVVLVDACRSGAKAGTLHRFDARTGTLPGWLNSVSNHGIGVAQGVELARALGGLPESCQVIAIEGAAFGVGADMSPEVAAAIPQCVDLARKVLG